MINFAIVGAGFIAKKHIDAIEKTEGAQLVAVCDTNPERLAEYEGKVNTFTDLEEMLKNQGDLHVVNICTPSGLHERLVSTVASYKKHIIVEKPMALTVEDSEAIITEAKEHGIKLAVLHPNRFRPAIKKLREVYDAGKFGKLSHANATVRWNRGQEYYDQAPWRGTKKFDGGVLMNQAIHNLDLLLWFMGPVESVQAMAATRFRKIETEDLAAGVIQFQSGALGIIEAATTIYPKNLEESLSIFGETGSVKISGRNANFIETWDFQDVSEEEAQSLAEEIKADPFGKPGHQCIVEDMVAAINENREPVVGGEDGLAPVKLIAALLESAETGKKVTFN
ncbi:gfo/Idh/MocA family oxidoreductase [Bacillus lacus]|uniref:Gfo/Idh/MocA family oxidoreductase n=1 Tax=Metabacillus lacus TaxID=1983721 RepID=A0A7X2IYJ5_9BACI|nr:Gfo/Idh/MocA family oxidoreductase [Metabacillus lacus]MRX72165.1 gfo/Idh/MocA family oxidoreductase [Metabacillus lacus]